jgi:HlyD family secretion protein
MKKKILIIGGILIIIAVLIIANLSSKEKAILVQTEKIFRDDITQTVTGNGKIFPVTEVNISAKVAGEILKINAEEGDSVKRGEVLVVLDSKQYEAMRDRQKFTILGARAEVKVKKNEWDRAQQLFQQNLLSKSELEVAEAGYEKALSMLQQAEASLEEAKDAVDKTVLKAPMDGVVIQKNKEIGEMALGSQFQEDVILTIADLTEMESRVEINENDIINVSLGDSSYVEIDAFPDTTFRGIVSEISHSAETTGQGTIEQVTNYEVRVRLINKLPAFRPGMSATADIATETKKDVLNIPIQCLTAREPDKLLTKKGVETTPAQREGDSIEILKKKKKKTDDLMEVVFIVEDRYAKMRQIKVGISDDNYYEVLEGVSEGEEVITGPFKILSRLLKDGDRIKAMNKEEQNRSTKEE